LKDKGIELFVFWVFNVLFDRYVYRHDAIDNDY